MVQFKGFLLFEWLLVSNCREPPRDGANIDGLVLEGARWDNLINSLVNSRPKELFFEMPLIHIRAITKDKQELRSVYECPVYRTRYDNKLAKFMGMLLYSHISSHYSLRGPTYVWTFNLKTREKQSKWILGGVAIVLQP